MKIIDYGGNKTIHDNGCVDVETTEDGQVVAVWFRCMRIPFIQTPVSEKRANEMRNCGNYTNILSMRLAITEERPGGTE